MLARHLPQSFFDALADTPVVLVVGACQMDRSTLARAADFNRAELILGDLALLSVARGGLRPGSCKPGGLVLIDEAQRVPELFLPMKAAVDRARVPGSFLLTDSANVLALALVWFQTGNQ